MASALPSTVDPSDESLIILQSLLCLLRERNILSRADIEELSQNLRMRAAGTGDAALSCCPQAAAAASENMDRMNVYIGRRYGGKHARGLC